MPDSLAERDFSRHNLLVSESEFDRQARILLESAQSQIVQIQSRLTLAEATLERTTKLTQSNAGTKQQLDTDIARVEGLKAELSQSQGAERSAQETLASGSNRLKAVSDELKRTEAVEREARVALEAESDGMNPDVRQTIAELDRKRWDLEQTTVRAPSHGYAALVTLRPGQMATPFSMTSAMLFVPAEKRWLVATFPQNAIAGIEPGLEAEIAFKAYPGRIFQAKVARVQPIIPEGDIIGTGQLQSTTAASAFGNIPVTFEYGEDVEALNLPTGAQASIAVYTHYFHALSLIRKIILRVKSWENYAFFMHNFDAVH